MGTRQEERQKGKEEGRQAWNRGEYSLTSFHSRASKKPELRTDESVLFSLQPIQESRDCNVRRHLPPHFRLARTEILRSTSSHLTSAIPYPTISQRVDDTQTLTTPLCRFQLSLSRFFSSVFNFFRSSFTLNALNESLYREIRNRGTA